MCSFISMGGTAALYLQTWNVGDDGGLECEK